MQEETDQYKTSHTREMIIDNNNINIYNLLTAFCVSGIVLSTWHSLSHSTHLQKVCITRTMTFIWSQAHIVGVWHVVGAQYILNT